MLRFLNKSCSSDEYDDHMLQDFITVARQVSVPEKNCRPAGDHNFRKQPIITA